MSRRTLLLWRKNEVRSSKYLTRNRNRRRNWTGDAVPSFLDLGSVFAVPAVVSGPFLSLRPRLLHRGRAFSFHTGTHVPGLRPSFLPLSYLPSLRFARTRLGHR